ncbi:unnamed protein product [Absidia cylindrospora]
MTSQIAQVAGFKLKESTSLSLSVDDAVSHAKTAGTLLENMLSLLEPNQVSENEMIKDAYKECLLLKEYLSEQLWSVTDTEGVNNVQNALDILTRAIVSYEMMKDALDGDWELVDMRIPGL